MDFSVNSADWAVLTTFRSYLDELKSEGYYPTEPLVSPDHAVKERDLQERKRFIRRLGQDSWLGVSWPISFGGKGLSPVAQWLIMEELALRKLPAMLIGVSIVGPTLIHMGSETQKNTYLSGLLTAEYEFCLGYSEPQAGSDLGNLRCRARKLGEGYKINGQKIYTTGAHYATHIWLATRTGDPDSRSRGVTVLIVPTDSPGITIRPLYTGADYRTNEVFFDDVFVPIENRVGEENDGWAVIGKALQFERTRTSNRLVREYLQIYDWVAKQSEQSGSPDIKNPLVRSKLAMLAVDLHVARLFSLNTADDAQNGAANSIIPSVSKIWATELGQRIAEAGLELIGELGSLKLGESEAPLKGNVEMTYRESTVYKFAAGTNEIQRDIVAQRGLGLPRRRRKQG